jgi:hypothetical protein
LESWEFKDAAKPAQYLGQRPAGMAITPDDLQWVEEQGDLMAPVMQKFLDDNEKAIIT